LVGSFDLIRQPNTRKAAPNRAAYGVSGPKIQEAAIPYNGSGVFNPLITFIPHTPATAEDQNDQDSDIANGLSNALTRDGQAGMTADLDVGGFKLLQVADGVNPTDGVNLSQVQALAGSNVHITGGTITGVTASPAVNFLTGSPIVKTAAYTVQNADKGGFLTMGGGAFYTLSFGSPAGYDADFIISIYNEDTNRAKFVSLAGAGSVSFMLYPGTGCIIKNDAQLVWIQIGKPPRWVKQNPTFYVDAGAGNDSNDGLASGTGGAFKTIRKAINTLYQDVDADGSFPLINVANGTYRESIALSGQPPGAPVIFLTGSTPLGVNWQPASSGTPYCFLPGDGTVFELTNIQFDGNGINAVAIQMHQYCIVDILGGCGFGSFGTGSHVATDGCGGTINFNANYAVNGAGGAAVHISVPSVAMVNITSGITVTISNSPNIGIWFRQFGSGSNISLGSSINFSGSPLAGCQKWSTGPGATISLSGNAANVPGSVAGNPAVNVAPIGTTGWAVS